MKSSGSRTVLRPRQRESRAASAIPEASSSHAAGSDWGAATQVPSARSVTSRTMRSKALSGAGSAAPRAFASQLRVKLGTMRPPTSAISMQSVAMPRRMPSGAR